MICFQMLGTIATYEIILFQTYRSDMHLWNLVGNKTRRTPGHQPYKYFVFFFVFTFEFSKTVVGSINGVGSGLVKSVIVIRL